MEFTLSSLQNALLLMSWWEVLAAILGVAYILLAAKESLWTWLFGFFSTLIYTIIFWEGALVSSSLLNFYYMIMAGYGYYTWSKGKAEGEEMPIETKRVSFHIKTIVGGAVIATIIGYLSSTYSDAKLAYMDSLVLVFSVIATWMLTQKLLENWLYWLVIDSVAVVLYWQSGYLVTVLLFITYMTLGLYGYLQWRREFYENS